MSQTASAALTIAMVAAFVLIGGGVKLAMVAESRSRGVLMIVAALVLIGNVMIWTL